jgi:hypothetical protein
MSHPNPWQIARRTLRFTGPVASLLQGIASAGPLYTHAWNWMAELASIVPLSEMMVDAVLQGRRR